MKTMHGVIKESAFVERRRVEWDELESLMRRGLKKIEPLAIARLSPLYRDVCADLARARAARYSAPLIEYLDALTASAHALLYGRPTRAIASRIDTTRNYPVLAAFPRAVRRRWRAMLLAACLFFLPMIIGVVAATIDPTFAFKIVPQAMLEPLTDAYAKGFADGRTSGDGAMMAGFYINNNVGIALRCFALGIFGGLGSAIYLVHNGLSIGAILGYVASQGAGRNIVTFIVGHGSLELGAIVLAGGAGLAIGWSIVAPGDRRRIDALQESARDVVVIVIGAAAMLLMAAGIEAFWSGSSVPASVKQSVGAALAILVVAYLTLAGRDRRGSP